MPTSSTDAPEDTAAAAVPTPDTEEDGAPDLILLDPETLRLFRTGGSAVRMTVEGVPGRADRSYVRVQIARAFPFSMPSSYFGIRDAADKDVGLLVTLDGLAPESRRIVDEELERRYFLPRILRVLSVKEEPGLVAWDVETDKGRRQFYIQNLRESVHTLGPPTRLLLTDKDCNRFEIADVSTMDAKTRAVLNRTAG